MNGVDDLMSYSDGDLREWIKRVVFESETSPIHIDPRSSSRIGSEIGDILQRYQDILIRVFQWLCEDLCEYFKTWPEGNRSFSQDITLEDNLVLSLILGHIVEGLSDPIKAGNPTDQVVREISSLLDDEKRISMCKEPISIQQRCLEALGVLGPIGDLPRKQLVEVFIARIDSPSYSHICFFSLWKLDPRLAAQYVGKVLSASSRKCTDLKFTIGGIIKRFSETGNPQLLEDVRYCITEYSSEAAALLAKIQAEN